MSADGFTELDQFSIDENSVRLLSYKFCVQNYVVVLGVVEPDGRDPVTVGMLDTGETRLIEELERILCRSVTPVLLNAYEIKKALDIGHSQPEVRQEKFKLRLGPVSQVCFEPDCSTAQLINEILGRAITIGASDVHVECYEDDVDVRFRVDGILHQMSSSINRANVNSIVSRLKILADLDIAERRISQDGRLYATFEAEGEERPIDFRLSILPGPFGEDAVLRILDSKKPLIGLEKLGCSEQILGQLRSIVHNPEGLVLVTGPTGSGKTTTLYSVLQEINTVENKILTVEDPIEYLFPKINQKQIGPRMSFVGYARAFLRQDPDIMMVGEIRDEETADMALRAAQTGHLVLATLHSDDSVGTVPRLRTLGIGPGMIADCLLGSLSQRLVRRICTACRRDVEPDRFALEVFERLGLSFPLVEGEGCERCRNTGYRGRIGMFELFIVDQEMADMMSDGTPGHEIRQVARRRGMRSLFGDALEKVRAGITTFSEVRRTVPYRILMEP
jgi:general secretion pathway protein E/type IV pilus assembly protein PilB